MAFDFTEDKDRRVESCRLKIIEVVMSVLVQLFFWNANLSLYLGQINVIEKLNCNQW